MAVILDDSSLMELWLSELLAIFQKCFFFFVVDAPA
jgi:hypothetical protein